MSTLPFTIDAELLRELGERLVGKPHIVLAELVKNSYDADATEVTINFSPDKDFIEVRDNGHGMTYENFKNFWMRIGTTHKSRKHSKVLGRPMTGSKGVGRLAVQFLASELEIKTVPAGKSVEWLEFAIDWEEAIKVKELTKVEVGYSRNKSDKPFRQGTSVILRGLKHEWKEDSVSKLASELWWLQPPFGATSPALENPKDQFRIYFRSTKDYARIFAKQMQAIKGIWIARLVGRTDNGEVTLSLQFQGEQPIYHRYSVANFTDNNGKFNKEENLNKCNLKFESTIYRVDRNLESRLVKPGNISLNMEGSMFMMGTFVFHITVSRTVTG